MSFTTKAIALSIVTLALASCTTNQTALDMRLPEVEAHVVGDNNTIARSIASIDDTANYETSFQNIFHSDDPARETQAYLERTTRLFYYAQGLLNDFDARLDQIAKDRAASEAALQTDDTYARLISAWMVHDATHEKVRYLFARALQQRMDQGDESEDAQALQARATRMVNVFKKFVNVSNNASDRLAKQDVIFDLLTVSEGFSTELRAHEDASKADVDDLASLTSFLSKQVVSDPSGLQRLYAQNSNSLARKVKLARTDQETAKEIASEIESHFAEVKQSLLDRYSQREPQSIDTFKPDSGPSGTMSGSSFRPGRWAITFDDGPHPTYTLRVLANLKQYGLKTTFFWLAQNIPRLKTIVGEVKASEMVLANHSFSHPQLTKLSASGLQHEIVESSRVDTAVYGFKPTLFRCPYGACGPAGSNVRRLIASENMLSIIWNVDSLDWQDKNPTSVYQRVKKQMAVNKRGIILFHDIHPQSVAASKMVMADFAAGQRTGQYRGITIQQARDEMNSPGGMQ